MRVTHTHTHTQRHARTHARTHTHTHTHTQNTHKLHTHAQTHTHPNILNTHTNTHTHTHTHKLQWFQTYLDYFNSTRHARFAVVAWMQAIVLHQNPCRSITSLPVFALQHLDISTDQFKMVSMCSEKPICALPRLSEVSPTLPLKQFQCSPDWRWPSVVLSRKIV